MPAASSGLRAQLHALRQVANRGLVLRGLLLASLALALRLLTAATAWVLFEQSLLAKVAVSTALGLLFAVRALSIRTLGTRTEAELAQRAMQSVLDGDVLRPSLLATEDAHAELAQGVYFVAQALTDTVPGLVADTLASCALAIVIARVEPFRDWMLAGVLMVAGGLLLFWSRGRLQRAVTEAWKLRDRLVDSLVDAIEGRVEIVAAGEQRTFLDEADRRGLAWVGASRRAAAALLLAGRLPLLGVGAAVALAVLVEARLRGGSPVALADVALLAGATPAFAGFAQGVHSLLFSEPWLRIVAGVFADARPRKSGGGGVETDAAVAFEAVTYRYPDAKEDALHGVTLSLSEDRIVAFVGPNGSGKSTCLRLLLGLAAPREGAVTVGGHNLEEVDLELWRSRIAFLPQRAYLPLRLDVRAAVRFLAPAAADDAIHRALERVGLLRALAARCDDPLSASSDALSIGQRQRLALARLLCRRASLYVLDEPDANLDLDGVALVTSLIKEQSASHRVFFAAHDPELVAIADRVIHLDAGRIVRDERR